MDKKRWAELESKIAGVNHVVVCSECLSADYSEPTFPESDRTLDNGLLVFFELHPKRAGLPIFRARWDETDNTVDFDLLGDDDESLRFREQERGYVGHKTVRVSDHPNRIREVHIATPQIGLVFEGRIKICLAFEVSLAAGLYVTAGLGAEIAVERGMETRKQNLTHGQE